MVMNRAGADLQGGGDFLLASAFQQQRKGFA
jgi:hypothetical protein